ncbi:hypothetical protein A6770_34595 [Nostoc minutum NIES-26]|uniref:Uncharacterized protein n=1 Tax=Nostoc minutum NIES-26 TaxID=1844469 RepID=A0A367S316_9NOSO|nr:hypothetical protein A6770_34595 [Nostoc minutum NIES-26]
MSNYHVKRCNEEDNFYSVILQNYLIRVKGPALTGKTKFLNHCLQGVNTQKEFQIVPLYLNEDNWGNVDDVYKFLKWFCEEIARKLQISSYHSWQQDEDNLTPPVKCTIDFEKYFLKLKNSNYLILYFENFHKIFNNPEIFKSFTDLLRSWYSDVKSEHREWNRLRLILEYSTDSYVTNSQDSSALENIGYAINLKDFDRTQVQDLLHKFELKWSDAHLNQFMDIVNGHPYLVYKALEHLSKDTTYKIDHYLKDPAKLERIYDKHLFDNWKTIHKKSKLQEVFKKIILASEPIEVKVDDRQEAFHLFSMGLIFIDGDTAKPRCDLYRQYFSKYFDGSINLHSIEGKSNMNKKSYYTVGGPLSASNDKSYVTREADRKIIELLNDGKYCYVFNCHQMGKSSLQAHTSAELQNEGFAWILTDLARIGSGDNKQQWYNSLIFTLANVHTTDNSELLKKDEVDNWLNEQSKKERTPEKLLSLFIKEVLLDKIPQEQKLVIFIDEIGHLIKLDFSDDFLLLIRSLYTGRDNDKEFKRLTFVLLGVTTPQKLLKGNTGALNIGESVDLQGFTQEEAKKGLAKGLEGKAEDREKVIEAILDWTGGQPFLTQKLCAMIEGSSDYIKKGDEELKIKEIVESDIINKWRDKDEPTHLKSIESKVLFQDERQESRLRLYKKILDKDENQDADSIDVKLELRLSGLVIEKDQKLKLYNRIYENIFDKIWIEGELAKLEPEFYVKKKKSWIESGKDKKYLLVDNELSKAEEWAKGKHLPDEDKEFLSQSELEKEKKKIIKASILIGVLIVVFIVTVGIGISISRENNQKQKAQQELVEAQEKAQQELVEAQKKAQQELVEAQKKAQQESVEAQKKAQQELVEAQKKAQQESVQLLWKLVLGVSIILVIGLVLIIGFMGK